MTNSTASRPAEEVIFERYWAHACAQCHGLHFVEVRGQNGYEQQPIDVPFLTRLETYLSRLHDGLPSADFRRDVQVQVTQIFGSIGRMPTTAEILERIPALSAAVGEFARFIAGERQAA